MQATAFQTPSGKKLLLINKRMTPRTIRIEGDTAGAISYVAPSTGDGQPVSKPVAGGPITMEPFEVAVVQLR